MPNVLCIHMSAKRELPTGCEIYRAHMPLYHLGLHKPWKTQWGYFEQYYRMVQQHGFGVWDKLIDEHDIFLFPRMVSPNAEVDAVFNGLFDSLRSKGKTIIYEVDDDFTNDHRHVIDGDAMSVAAQCDAITVTTPYLANLMEQRTGRPAYVLPNMISPIVWKGAAPKSIYPDDALIIGLTGSTTHYKDWEVLAEVLPRIQESYSNTYIILGGFFPDYFGEMPRTTYVPGQTYEIYGNLIKLCDLILAPVDPDDKFNWSKSPIKVIEGMCAERTILGQKMGAACVATDMPVYQPAIRHEETGLLVEHTPQAWELAIRRLIDDMQFRHQLQREGYKYVWRKHNIDREWTQWSSAYLNIMKQAKKRAA